jgi:signal transduction histidine kinase
LESVSGLSRQALEDTRRLLSVLRTDDGVVDRSPQPGISDITYLVDQVSSTGVVARLTVKGAATPVTEGPALAAYRIVQESITNALKHAAGVTAIDVTMTWSPHHLAISVVDDGHCPPTRSPSETGFGLAGMRERAALYGGSAMAGCGPSGGWIVYATLPIDVRGAL